MRFSFLPMAFGLLLWPVLAGANGTPLNFKTDDAGDMQWSVVVMLALLALALLWALSIVARRRRQGRAGGAAARFGWLWVPRGDDALKLLASRRLSAKASLHVVEWEGKKLLVAATELQVVLLDRHEEVEQEQNL